jgi:hypothetical protein
MSKGWNEMILEGFLSGVVSNVLKEVITQAIVRKWKRLEEKEVEQILAAYLAQHPLVTQPIVKEVYMLMGASGLIDARGQITLSPFDEGPEHYLQRVYDIWHNSATYEIVSEFSGKVLDVWCYGTEDGVKIVQHRYLGATNQHWRLIWIHSS